MKQCRMGRFATLGVLYGCDTLAVCRACECKISEMVEFLNSDREHMQQGIFPDVQQSYLLHSALNFDEVSLCVSYLICTPYPPGINTGILGGGGTGMRAICICYDVTSHDILGEECCLLREKSETEL